MDGLLHQRDRGCGFLQLQVGRTGDVDQCAMRTLDAFLQQRRADGDFRGLRGAVLSPSGTDAEQRGAAPRRIALTSLKSTWMYEFEVIRSVMPCTPASSAVSAVLNASTMPMVRSDSSSSRSFGMTISASTSLRRFSMPSAAEAERCGPSKLNGRVTTAMVSAPCWWPHVPRNRAGTGSGATALTAGDEHHVGALKRLFDVGLVILRRLGTLFRVGASAQTTAGGIVQRDLDIGVGSQQILCISVDRNKFDALKTLPQSCD